MTDQMSPHVDASYRTPRIAQEALQYFQMGAPSAHHGAIGPTPNEVTHEEEYFQPDPHTYVQNYENARFSALLSDVFSSAGLDEPAYPFAIFQPLACDMQFSEERHAPDIFMSAPAIGHPA